MPGRASAFALKSNRVLMLGELRPLVVVVEGEEVRCLAGHDQVEHFAGLEVEDLGDLVLMPGLVDTHVHLNEPGNEAWEGIATGTAAAVAGGFTTVVDMPLNSLPVTTTPEALREKQARIEKKARCRVRCWGGLVAGMHREEIEALLDAGAVGLKAFLCDSGLPEFQPAGLMELDSAMRVLAERDLPLLVHAELPIEASPASGDPREHATWLASRPPGMEREAVALMLALCERHQCRTHIVHVADAGCLPLLRAAHRLHLPLTAETCPHYLCFAAEEIEDGATEFKCAPPIRDAANREALWGGLADGTLAMIVSDHSPCPPGMKARQEGNFLAAWGGIASLQVAFPAVWAEAAERGHSLAEVHSWMSSSPSSLLCDDEEEDTLLGWTGDILAVDPDARWTVRGVDLFHRHPLTPYEGREVRGRVERAWIGGRPVDPRDPRPLAAPERT